MQINPNMLRKHILKMVYDKKSGHIGGSFSICEIITYLYSNYDLIHKDKLTLSKGHAVPAIYAVLHELGLIKSLDSVREIGSPLQGHPDKNMLKYIHATTGSLGQGLSIAIGHALASKLKKINNKVFCIVGDGEMQEGQIWEALMLAPVYNLDNLVCFIDKNKMQNDGKLLGSMLFEEKIEPLGWDIREIDGHNIPEIQRILNQKQNVPLCVILNTIKGKGVSFMENDNFWHAGVPTQEQYDRAMSELDGKL
jgi:transketolase